MEGGVVNPVVHANLAVVLQHDFDVRPEPGR